MKAATRQRGAAAVELTLVMITGSLLLFAIVFCGRLAWQAMALHRAIYTATEWVADAPPEVISEPNAIAARIDTARFLARDLVAEAGVPTPLVTALVGVQCDMGGCGLPVAPQSVRMYTAVSFTAEGVGDGLVQELLGNSEVPLLIQDAAAYAP